MPKWAFIVVAALAALFVGGAGPSGALYGQGAGEGQFQVLSPWAEVDPIPLKGIAPRIDNLAGKKIGIFVNYKRAARPIGLSLERRLKAMYPDSEVKFFYSLEWNVSEIETKNKEKFAVWAKEADAVIMSVGD